MSKQTINDVIRGLGRVEGKVDGVISRLDRMNGTLDSHDKRININESKTDIITGKATVIGAITGAVFGFIGAAVIAFFKFWSK